MNRYFSQIDLLERVPSCFLILLAVHTTLQLLGFCLIFENKKETPKTNDKVMPLKDLDLTIQNMSVEPSIDPKNVENFEKERENLKFEELNSLGIK